MLIDIVVRAKDGHALTRECLQSIRKNTPPGSYRLILVDDGSDPALGDVLTDVYIRSRQNCGAVTATNAGIGFALWTEPEGHVLVMDNDTVIPDGDMGWLSRMEAEFVAGGLRTGAVGATTNYASGFQHVLRVPQTYSADWLDEKAGRGGMAQNPPVPVFVSFAVLIRKDVLRQLGPWDQRYNPGNWEDTDYSVQLRLAGWEIRVARSVYVKHVGHQTFKGNLARLLRENGEKFAAKWGVGTLFDLGIVGREQMKEMLEMKP